MSPSDEEDDQWRRLRRANSVRLLLFPLIVILFVSGWTLWFMDPASGR
jgi:hypothetical protein